MKREMTCIACPIGCRLSLDDTGGPEAITVEGNRCERGEIYAREEALAPKRVVTATVPLSGGSLSRISVRTGNPLAKELIPSLLSELYGTVLEAPVKIGDVIIDDFRSTGVRVVATRNGPRKI